MVKQNGASSTVARWAALDGDARKRVDESVTGTGWDAILAHEPRHRVTKRGFDLVLADD